MSDLRYSLLDDPIVTVRLAADARITQASLCELYPMLARDEVADFPALRPHQRHVWHAFLVQVAALALHAAGLNELPESPTAWRTILLALTPDDPDGAAWALIAPLDRPALLQPPVPERSLKDFKRVETAGALDMLVSARNHDVKRHTMRRATAEAWLFALVSVQTQGPSAGGPNKAVSRISSGFSSRSGLGIVPPGGPGTRVVRDAFSLLDNRPEVLSQCSFYPTTGGLGLVWLKPWDGKTKISLDSLDPFYVEICRRIRFTVDHDGQIAAWKTGTNNERIDAKALNGRIGDPWTPLVPVGGVQKAFNLRPGGFSYQCLVPLLFPQLGEPDSPVQALLQRINARDAESGLTVLARGNVGGEGGTGGYHERRVSISRMLRRLLGPATATDNVAKIAAERVENAGVFARKVLFPTAMTIFTAAPGRGERARDDDVAKARARTVAIAFERAVDARFFVDLDAEVELLEDSGAMRAVRGEWLLALRDIGRRLVDEALAAAPDAAMRHYRIAARARRRFESAFQSQFGEWMPEQLQAATAGVVKSDTPESESTLS